FGSREAASLLRLPVAPVRSAHPLGAEAGHEHERARPAVERLLEDALLQPSVVALVDLAILPVHHAPSGAADLPQDVAVLVGAEGEVEAAGLLERLPADDHVRARAGRHVEEGEEPDAGGE